MGRSIIRPRRGRCAGAQKACKAQARALGLLENYVAAAPREAVMALKISTHEAGSVTVVSCSGRIVFGEEAADLREVVKSLLERNQQIVIDLGGVTYIDSGGLGTLV